MIINSKEKKYTIEISSIESDLCVALYKKLLFDWRCFLTEEKIKPLEIGWVSYDDFIESVTEWFILKKTKDKAGDIFDDTIIINAINRLNIKIRKELKLQNPKNDLIENGAQHRMWKNYRFRIHPKFIKIED